MATNHGAHTSADPKHQDRSQGAPQGPEARGETPTGAPQGKGGRDPNKGPAGEGGETPKGPDREDNKVET